MTPSPFAPLSAIFASRATKSSSSFSNIELIAGVSCDGSMAVNFGRSVHSNRGLDDVDVDAASTVEDMARDEELREEEEDGTDGTDRVVFDDDDGWRREFLAADEKARMGEALREASTVKANAMGDTFIIFSRGVLDSFGVICSGSIGMTTK